MAEAADKDSKTEEATEKKIRDTVEKGQLPFSKEAPIFASFVIVLLFTVFFAHSDIARLGVFLSMFLEKADEWPLATELDAIALYRLVLTEIVRVLAVFMALVMAGGIAASVFQNAPRVVLDRIQPKFSRISLKEGWQRLFGVKGVAEFVKSLAKLGFASTFLVLAMSDAHRDLLAGMITHPAAFGLVIRDLLIDVLTTMTFAMALIAAADVAWSRFHWKHDLRMTRQEVKDELKQSDGDPVVKARMRSLQRDRARNRMMAAVPRATLIIANPTHFSIALRYVREESAAPVVLAKGQDLLALKIREIAAEHNVPVFENVELARAMYKQVSVDSMIPPQFYQAVAELVRIVYAKTAQPSTARVQ
jgi:flagellar biosynthesis protein FlhB